MTTHYLKTLKKYFMPVMAGKKRFELRKNDRNFQVGDILCLQECIKDKEGNVRYTGKEGLFRISYIFRGGKYGLKEGYAILSIIPLKEEKEEKDIPYPMPKGHRVQPTMGR